MKKRLTAMLMCLCLLVTALPATAFAEVESGRVRSTAQSGLCEHHPHHDEDCGYTEGTEGSLCTHEHDGDCYTLMTECAHEHTEECYTEEGDTEASPSEYKKQKHLTCTHVCSEESGCITKALDCRHEHDEACGYVSATEGTLCVFVCEICSDQDSGDTATPSDAQTEGCTCETLCTEEEVNGDCPVCGAEGADLTACEGLETLSARMLMANMDNKVSVGGKDLIGGSTDGPVYATTDDSGTVTIGGNKDDYNIMWDGDTLTLKDATIKGPNGIRLYSKAEIVLIGENEVFDEYSSSGITSDTDIIISGEGKLTASGSNGISSDNGNITIEGGDITVFGNGNNGISSGNGDITIEEGNISATGIRNGIYSGNGSITIEGGDITAIGNGNDGIYAHEHIKVSGEGELEATGSNNGISSEGDITIESGEVTAVGNYKYGIFTYHGDITISGGKVRATSNSINGYVIYIDFGDIDISGGTVTAIATGKTNGIRAGKSGSVNISGGNVTVVAEGDGCAAFDVYYGKVNISGGNVTARGNIGYGFLTINTGGCVDISGGTVNAWGKLAGICTAQTVEGSNNGILKITGGIVMAGGEEAAIMTAGEYEKGNCIIFEHGVGTVYGESILSEDFEIKNGHSLTIPAGSVLIVSEGIELTVNGNLIIEDGGILSVNGSLSGDGSITPGLQTQIVIEGVNKTYDGEPVSEEDVSYTYTGASVTPAITVTWHSDNGGHIGDELSQVPSVPGTYWVKITAAKTGFYASAETEKKFTIEKGSLSAPKSLSLTSPEKRKGLASWDEVANASSYLVQLYKEGQPFGTEVTTAETAYEFTVTEEGSYSFGVKALGDDRFYDESPKAKSEALDIYTDA